MNKKLFILFGCALIVLSCSKDDAGSANAVGDQQSALNMAANPASVSGKGSGAVQVSGIGYFAEASECDVPSQGAAYAIRMTGDLQGCWYTYVDEFRCSPSGTYREVGREYFVGTYKGVPGTLWTTYKFEAKYEGCAVDGSYIGAEIRGRCQHPIIEGTGTGGFEGVKGRVDFLDDIEAGNYPYRGHFLY